MTAGGIEVWLVDLERACEGLHEAGQLLGLLLEEDADQIAPLADEIQRRRRRAARIAMRLALWAAAGREVAAGRIARMPDGKPMPPSAGLEISLSHTPAHALLAISRAGPVGVDIEVVRRVQLSDQRRRAIELAGRLLAPKGPHAVAGSDESFVQAWTRIEALAKLTGAGAAATLARLGVRQAGADASAIAAAVDAAQTQFPAGPAIEVGELQLPEQRGSPPRLIAALARIRGTGPVGVATLPTDRDSLMLLAQHR